MTSDLLVVSVLVPNLKTFPLHCLKLFAFAAVHLWWTCMSILYYFRDAHHLNGIRFLVHTDKDCLCTISCSLVRKSWILSGVGGGVCWLVVCWADDDEVWLWLMGGCVISIITGGLCSIFALNSGYQIYPDSSVCSVWACVDVDCVLVRARMCCLMNVLRINEAWVATGMLCVHVFTKHHKRWSL